MLKVECKMQIKKITGIIVGITVFAKTLGFFRDVALSYFFGAGSISDAFVISQNIPVVLASYLGMGIVVSVVPIIKQHERTHGHLITEDFVRILLFRLFVLMLLVTLPLYVFSNQVVRIMAFGLSEESIALVVLFTRITLWTTLLTVVINLYIGYMNSQNYFVYTAFITVPFNLTVIIGLIISYYTSQNVIIAFSIALGVIMQLVFLLPSILRRKYYPKLDLKKRPEIREIVKNSAIMAMCIPTFQICTIVDKSFGSSFFEGGISILNYSTLIILLVVNTIVIAVVTPSYTQITTSYIQNDFNRLNGHLCYTVKSILFYTVPAVVGLLIYSDEIITVVYNRGEFDANAVFSTSITLVGYSLAIIPLLLREIYIRLLFVKGRIKPIVMNTTFTIVLNIILNIISGKIWGFNSIPVITSTCMFISFLHIQHQIHNEQNLLANRDTIHYFLKILLVSILIILVGKIAYRFLNHYLSYVASFGIGIVLSMLIYLISTSKFNLMVEGEYDETERDSLTK